uniref:Uncharacterized protein n=1 Tax=Lepeophtheirus salmonis TaxID=72036 RepID=A0A0K2UQ09_LEPSM
MEKTKSYGDKMICRWCGVREQHKQT